MRQESGFTLIEVMVVVAIIGVMVGIAIPNFTQWQDRNRLHQTTAEVATQLTMARMVAMNRNRNVDVTIQNNGNSVRVSAVLSSTTATTVLDKTIEYTGNQVIGSPVTVSFSSMGQRISGGTAVNTIGICNVDKLQYSVTIIPVGKVNWSTNASATPCP
jgi:type II secretion system protein H